MIFKKYRLDTVCKPYRYKETKTETQTETKTREKEKEKNGRPRQKTESAFPKQSSVLGLNAGGSV